MNKHLYNHFKHMMSPKQLGFVKIRSTTSNLLYYTYYIYIHRYTFNGTNPVDSIYIYIYPDFSEAFDPVNHSVLLLKVHNMGIHGNLYRWLSSYLLNRSQLVTISGTISVPYLIILGVP